MENAFGWGNAEDPIGKNVLVVGNGRSQQLENLGDAHAPLERVAQ